MKKRRIFIGLLILYGSFLQASCYYVPCAPSVQASTAMITQQYEIKFKEIQDALSQIEQSYKEYYEAEKTYNVKLKQYEALKKEYLLLLKEVAYIKSQEVSLLKGSPSVVK